MLLSYDKIYFKIFSIICEQAVLVMQCVKLQGGLKAVVWTDTLQGVFFVSAIFAVVIIGTTNVGGLGEVIRIASEKGRLEMFE